MLRWCLTILLASIVLAAPAQALPPDPPPVPLTPADGAAVPVDPGGIAVTFSCPVYRVYSAGEGFDVYGGPKDYGLSMSSSPAVGADGRLAEPVALVSGASSDAPDHCVSALAAGGSQRPQETPGTYYWQVWRLCTGCPGSYEAGPVRALILRATATLALKPPAKVYAGFPFILPVTATGVPNFAALRIERGGSANVGAATVTSERAEATVTLGAGTSRLRAAVRIGDETVLSPEIRIKVARAANWRTRASDDGRYKGTRSAKLKVAKRGREIRGLSVSVAMLCPTPGLLGQFTTQLGVANVKRIKIAPDGSFVGVATPKAATSIRVRGKLKSRRLSGGRAELSVGTCSGSALFSAKRT